MEKLKGGTFLNSQSGHCNGYCREEFGRTCVQTSVGKTTQTSQVGNCAEAFWVMDG